MACKAPRASPGVMPGMDSDKLDMSAWMAGVLRLPKPAKAKGSSSQCLEGASATPNQMAAPQTRLKAKIAWTETSGRSSDTKAQLQEALRESGGINPSCTMKLLMVVTEMKGATLCISMPNLAC